jgi:PHP family Zn ribbon phosphoesterase
MQDLAMDLHVHTVLSACAEAEMLPPLIVQRALELGLAAIAVTDHNSAENVSAVRSAAWGSSLVVLPGMEVQTREEVHLLAIFDEVEQALLLQGAVYASLPQESNRPEFFGEQWVVSPEGEPLRQNTRLLQTSTHFSVETAIELVHERGGICLAAHVDRPAFSLIANLGFVPAGLALDGVELSRTCLPARFVSRHQDLAGFGVTCSGDAHRLQEMTARTHYMVEAASVAELRLALAQRHGRSVRILEPSGCA